jgi:amino acid transporter
MILGYKLIMKSERVRPENADLFKGKEKVDKKEEAFLAQQAAKIQNKKRASWFYGHVLGWLF